MSTLESPLLIFTIQSQADNYVVSFIHLCNNNTCTRVETRSTYLGYFLQVM